MNEYQLVHVMSPEVDGEDGSKLPKKVTASFFGEAVMKAEALLAPRYLHAYVFGVKDGDKTGYILADNSGVIALLNFIIPELDLTTKEGEHGVRR